MIINDSMRLSIFPDIWRQSRISPIPNNDNPLNLDDLWPIFIAILPFLSKIYEWIVAHQIIKHLEQQSSFYEGHVSYTGKVAQKFPPFQR